MIRSKVVCGLFLLVAACSQEPGQTGSNQASANEKTTAPVKGAADERHENGQQTAPARATNPGTLPPAGAALRFVGRWATKKADCTSSPWQFTSHALSAPAGPNCSIYKVSEVAGGYDLAAQCPAKKPLPSDLIKLRFAQSAQAMLVESNAIPPTGLIYCGK